MPWPHCGVPDIRDDLACPTCGITKVEWTIKVASTRVFKLSGRPACKVSLARADGSPAEGAAYRVEFPDGTTAEGTLDGAGYVKADSKLAGDAVVSFPGQRAEPAGTAVRPAPGRPEGEAFLCAVGAAKHVFRLVGAGRWVELTVLDDRGLPVPGEPFVVRLSDGTTRTGVVDGVGHVRLADLPEGEGEVELAFPRRDQAE